ncbi:hypothetical protein [Neobacillus mesonae]|uniref:Uncharacterized protein n=1 Tax=Neobacillus mesonae TaxID=1193713 RepID=A0A3T0I2V6_9BACI|nr:hypothetical protein [Neobacillus mesonae]AZU63653.1 hypothetical protein CHR53_21585 [Neobacillus mesonae]
MSNQTVFFKDNFFSAGVTEIFNSEKEKVGELDLKSTFSSSVDVLDKDGRPAVSGSFGFFSNKWRVTTASGEDLGILKQIFTFMSKKYEYDAYGRGVYLIHSEAFSREYDIFDEQSNQIAKFEKVSGFFASPAFQLTNYSDKLSTEELIAVVMGVNAIQKRRSNNAATANGGAGN